MEHHNKYNVDTHFCINHICIYRYMSYYSTAYVAYANAKWTTHRYLPLRRMLRRIIIAHTQYIQVYNALYVDIYACICMYLFRICMLYITVVHITSVHMYDDEEVKKITCVLLLTSYVHACVCFELCNIKRWTKGTLFK